MASSNSFSEKSFSFDKNMFKSIRSNLVMVEVGVFKSMEDALFLSMLK
jgi:hypothetical protein